jgi:hypothetical protein
MIKLDWIHFIRDNIWFGWIYYGPPMYGNPFAKGNWIYWQDVCNYDGDTSRWIIKVIRVR